MAGLDVFFLQKIYKVKAPACQSKPDDLMGRHRLSTAKTKKVLTAHMPCINYL
jgi:hypothetical protein